jgi:hypothetical protein
MTAPFILISCAYCGQDRPVAAGGRLPIHFLGNGEPCAGSDLDSVDFDADPARSAAIAYVMRAAARRLTPFRGGGAAKGT